MASRQESNLGMEDRSARRSCDALREAESAQDDGQSRHVRGGDRQRDHHVLLFTRSAAAFKFNLQITLWLWFTVLFANFAEAMAEGRGKAQADTLRKARSETMANRLAAERSDREGAQLQAARGRYGARVRRGVHSGRWRNHRRRRFGRRVGHHRRIRSGHSRSGRRPLRGHRRHARAFRPDQSQDHVQSRRNISRSHDRAGGRRGAAEDAERDRAEHSACRTDHHLPAGGRHAAALRDLLGLAANRVCAGLAAGLPDSHDHRRTCSPPSASRAWIAWCSTMCSRCRAAPWKPRAM